MRALIVEDEKDIQRYLKQSLEDAGFAVDAETNGAKGSFLANTNDYDIAVLDMRLPDMTGLEICESLRKKGRQFPVLILTVVSDTDSKVEALNAGADDYLTKPFDIDELLARTRALLRRHQQIVGEQINFGELSLDTRAHRVEYSGKTIKLTKKEFSVLEYFMRNPGTLLTRNMILDHVWDMETDPFSNSVDVHVRSLRRKLTKVRCPEETIETVRGYGYRFNPRK